MVSNKATNKKDTEKQEALSLVYLNCYDISSQMKRNSFMNLCFDLGINRMI